MKTRMNQNSLHDLQAKRVSKKQQIFDCICNNPGISQPEISKKLGISRATVSARCNDLWNEQLIKVAGVKRFVNNSQPFDIYIKMKNGMNPNIAPKSDLDKLIDELREKADYYRTIYPHFNTHVWIDELVEKFRK